MEWINGDIYIVELSTPERGSFVSAFDRTIGHPDVVDRYLKGHLAAYIDDRPDGEPRLEPDASYGPEPGEGSLLPQGFTRYNDWRTLVLEVGHARTWGTDPGMLDWKAQQWSGVPGVRFVLCVAVTSHLATAEYKLYIVHSPARPLRVYRADILNLDPVPIVTPRTEVSFDARLLLGLEPGDPLPRDPPTPNGAEFPDPLVVDLYQVLVLAQVVSSLCTSVGWIAVHVASTRKLKTAFT